MKLYLTNSSIPELKGLSKKQQKQAWRACTTKVWFGLSWWLSLLKIWMVICVLLISVTLSVGYVTVFHLETRPRVAMAVSIVALAVLSLLSGAYATHTLVKQMRPHFRKYLEEEHERANQAFQRTR